ncbi:MAG: sarcosine oxidase, subunit gamma [Mycobacterium sp.]|jgi:sarcosine oxidase subunit gamma|nr:sarcosine oxidase, subunit gamma [Mycobacterium sp.]
MADTKAVSITEEPFATMVDVRVGLPGPGASAAAEALGVALPAAAATYAENGDTTAIWLGPDEWLVTTRSSTGEEFEARLREAIAPHGGAAVDVSGQRTTLRLSGSHARDVLAKGCALDLHPKVFGVGSAAQTMLGQAGIVLLALDDGASDFRVLVRSSFARYVVAWLLDAMAEYRDVSA